MIKLTQPGLPLPPPPPPPETLAKKRFHGPETHFFSGIRASLTILEQGVQWLQGNSLKKGLILALVLGATLSFALSLVVQLATGMSSTDFVLLAVVAPITEEIFKGLSILIVALYVWKRVPTRRHGAVLGAAAGLGFSISENILFSVSYASLSGQVVNNQAISGGYVAELIVSRWLSVPFMHVLWSAFVGVGVFVLLCQRKTNQNVSSWLAAPFLLLGVVVHIIWNSVALALSGLTPLVITGLDVVLIFLPFAIIFRDFLGGHFNFQDFLRSVPEPIPYRQTSPFPPPPPPP